MVTICQKSTGCRVWGRWGWGSVCSVSLTSTDRITKRPNLRRTESTLHASRNTNDWLIKQWWRTGASFVLKSFLHWMGYHKVERADAVRLYGCVLKTLVIYQLLSSHPSPWSYTLWSYKMYNASHIICTSSFYWVLFVFIAKMAYNESLIVMVFTSVCPLVSVSN